MPTLFGALRKPASTPSAGTTSCISLRRLIIEEAELDETLAALDGAIGELETAYAASLK